MTKHLEQMKTLFSIHSINRKNKTRYAQQSIALTGRQLEDVRFAADLMKCTPHKLMKYAVLQLADDVIESAAKDQGIDEDDFRLAYWKKTAAKDGQKIAPAPATVEVTPASLEYRSVESWEERGRDEAGKFTR